MEAINWLEWFGYAASVVVAVSLMMSSIVKLRWYNLIGAGMFSAYGFLIGAMPVGFLNGFIALADIYYIIKIYQTKEDFEILNSDFNSEYFSHFFKYYSDDIKNYFPDFESNENKKDKVVFFVLRNMIPANLVVGEKAGDKYIVDVDYATPQYRDFKLGRYLFEEMKDNFKKEGINVIVAKSNNEKHSKYLKKIGFNFEKKEGNNELFSKNI
ncbi:hypothetical protein [Haliovirga abyssi]|uniref:N-acetyltransferase domain-containing protein n=1 Tax=Haliovirga abyssi TaxID=2996794 RepID=A0AAU9DJ87_9FUSO|nr:hypothetical protein [Haliovirga abyssi]BDU50849.1 hypothetical protein HLVA_14180 [Haliovirga abyssi]